MEGFTLIEIMIVIILLGIISIFGGNYFVSFLQEHRISVQNSYLQREATFAMDSIINGRMIEEDGEFFRISGIIGASDVDIRRGGEEILLRDIDGARLGLILIRPIDNIQTLLFDEDEINENGNEHRIIPTPSSEAPIQDPYGIEISFEENRNLINIRLRLNQELEQEANGRNLEVIMNSAVMLRNQFE